MVVSYLKVYYENSNLNQNHKEKLENLGFELDLVAVEKGVIPLKKASKGVVTGFEGG